jgi:hypothetical protein
VSSLRKLLAIRDCGDALPGEFVRWAGRKGVGLLVSKVDHGFAWVSWPSGRNDYLPVTVLRPVKHRGEMWDRRP